MKDFRIHSTGTTFLLYIQQNCDLLMKQLQTHWALEKTAASRQLQTVSWSPPQESQDWFRRCLSHRASCIASFPNQEKACNRGVLTGSIQKQQQWRDLCCDNIKFGNHEGGDILLMSFVTWKLETLKVGKKCATIKLPTARKCQEHSWLEFGAKWILTLHTPSLCTTGGMAKIIPILWLRNYF